MANVRIKDLSTTASTTASDDFFGVDGATNGTRKLNAYSPTFGGNLTVSGTGTSTFGGILRSAGSNLINPGDSGVLQLGDNASYNGRITYNTASNTILYIDNGYDNAGSAIYLRTRTLGTPVNAATFTSTAATIAGNLTVSGGTVSSGSGTLTLNSSANTVVLQSAGTTALTLDSSQNATFAKKISANGSTTWASASSAQLYWNTATGINLAGSGSSYDVSVLNKNGDLALYVPTGTQNVTIAGNLSVSGTGNSVFSGDLYVVGVITTQNGTASTPASASASGNAGTIKWDANYIYVCTATNTWKRVAIATW